MTVYVRLHGALRAYYVETSNPQEAIKAVSQQLSADGFVRFRPVLAVISASK